MILYLKDKEYEVKIKPFITAQLKGEGVDIFKRMEELDPAVKAQRRMMDIAMELKGDTNTEGLTEQEVYQKLLSEGKIPKETLRELTEIGLQISKLQPAIEKELDLLKIELFKLLVLPSSIPTDVKEVWEDKDFWKEQNLELMEQEIYSFREKSKLRVKLNF